jgi:hypothetical protein
VLSPDESILVIGTLITNEQGEVKLIASEIIKNNQFYFFRDYRGVPFWEMNN